MREQREQDGEGLSGLGEAYETYPLITVCRIHLHPDSNGKMQTEKPFRTNETFKI